MKKKSMIASVISFIAYPSLLVLIFVINLFRNQSFSIFGFGLNVNMMSNGAEIGLFMKPEFFISFIVIFAISLGLMMVSDVFKTKKG